MTLHSSADCGGCRGLGSHARWCPEKVGIRASVLGRYAEQAEDLADRIGAMDAEAANLIYRASSVLRAAAVEASAP